MSRCTHTERDHEVSVVHTTATWGLDEASANLLWSPLLPVFLLISFRDILTNSTKLGRLTELKGWLPMQFPWVSDSYICVCVCVCVSQFFHFKYIHTKCSMSYNIQACIRTRKQSLQPLAQCVAVWQRVSVLPLNPLCNSVGLRPSGDTPYLSVWVQSDEKQVVAGLFNMFALFYLKHVTAPNQKQQTRRPHDYPKVRFRKTICLNFVLKARAATSLPSPLLCCYWMTSRGLGTNHTSQCTIY